MRRYHKNDNGFTMAEMLITVAIIVILCGFGFVAVIAHQRNLKRMEMDETAQEIFIAAQNHLTAAEANGQWDAFLKKTSGVASEAEAARGTWLQNGPTGYDKSTDKDADSRKFYSFTTESVEAVQKGAVSLILPEGSIDETLRGHHFYVEYDAVSGTVYGVFYTDADHAITAEDAANVSRTDANARRDYKDENGKRTIIGYYGGALGELKNSGDLYAPSVAVRNAESLVLYVVDKNYHRHVSAQGGAGTFQTQLKLTFEGETSGAAVEKTVDPAMVGSGTDSFSRSVLACDSAKEFSVIVPGRSADEGGVQKTESVKAEYYAIVLDSIVREDGHFADLFAGAASGENGGSAQFIPGEDIKITVTLHSDNGGEDVSQTVTVNSLFNSVKQEKNALGVENGKAIVTVSNPRHLENLSTEVSGVDFTKIKSGTTIDTVSVVRNLFWDEDAAAGKVAKDQNENETVTAFLPAIASATGMTSPFGYCADGSTSIAKDEIQVYPYQAGTGVGNTGENADENSGSSNGDGAKAGGSENAAAEIAKGACYGITNTAIKTFEGNNHMLAAFRFEGEQKAALINEAADGLKISDLVIADATAAVTGQASSGNGTDPEQTPTAATLIADAKSGSIENIAVRWYEGSATSGTTNESVSLPAGKNLKTADGLEGCRVFSSKGIASALIGSIDAGAENADGKFTIKHTTVATVAASSSGKKTAPLGVEGETAAALVGQVKSGEVVLDNSRETDETKKSAVTVEGTLGLMADCGTKDNQTAGGLIGSIGQGKVQVKQFVLAADSVEINGAAAAGGVIGEVKSEKEQAVSLEDVNLVARSLKATSSEKYAGGLIGDSSGTGSVTVKNAALSLNTLEVNGKHAAGGAVGQLSAGSMSLEETNVLTTKAAGASGEAGQDATGDESQYGIRVTAENGTAGGLLGSATDNVTELTIQDTAVSGSGTADQIEAGSSAGGLIGDTKAASTAIRSSMASLYIKSKGNGGNSGGSSSTDGAGGLIGSASGNVTVENSYSGGRTTNADNPEKKSGEASAMQARYVDSSEGQGRYNVQLVKGSGAAGGLIGKYTGSSLTLKSSYSTSSVAVSKAGKGVAGGLIGEAEGSLTANSTYCTGRVYVTLGAGESSSSTKGESTPNYGTYAGKLGGISGQNNYYLKGMKGVPAGAIGTLGTNSQNPSVDEKTLTGADYYDDKCPLKQGVSQLQKSYYFDETIGTTVYPFKTQTVRNARPVCDPDTGVKDQNAEDDASRFAQIGDWEIPAEESSETEFGPYALIYYERIWDPETKKLDPTIYYHGYAIPDGAKGTDGSVKYKEISTKDGKLPDGLSWNEHHLVTSKGKYVAEDGYLLLVSNETIKNAGGEDHLSLHVRDSGGINNTAITDSRNYTVINTLNNISEQNEIIDQCNDFKGYTAYTLDAIDNNDTYRFRPSEKDIFGAGITIWKTDSDNSKWSAEAGFTYIPFFADAVRGADYGKYQSVSRSWAYNSADNTYINNDVHAIIRSAEQLQKLAKFGADSNGYLSWSAQSVWIEQKLDITFDDSKVLFYKKGKALTKDNNPDRYQSPTIKNINSANKFSSSTYEQNDDYYVLDGLNNKFVETVQGGSIFDLRITNMNAESVIDSVQQYGSDQNGAYVYNIHVSNSRLKKGMFRNITQSKVKDCDIVHSEIQENGFAETINNSADIENCNVMDAKIGKNGFAGVIGEANSCKVQNCSISNSTIGENGFAFEIKGNSSNVIGCSIVNAVIGENGFVNQYDGTIYGCTIYADPDCYKENEMHNYKPYSSGNGTYDYIAIGVKENGSKCENSIAGFAKSSSGSGAKIENCSVTGCIYGNNDVSGFVENVTAGQKIVNDYANVVIYTEKNAAGFANTIDGDGPIIQNCHALGVIRKAQNASGFINSIQNGSVLGNYEAFWNISANKWSPFYAGKKNSGTVSNNYYLTDCEVNVQEIAGYDDYAAAEAQGKTYIELAQTTIDGLSKTDIAHTKGYYQYMSSSEETYPYPMPSDQIAYGDWSYQKEDGAMGLVYYEKTDDVTYHMHGFKTFNGENYTEIGTLPSQLGTIVKEDGYLLIAKKEVLAANFTSTKRMTGISAPEDISKTSSFVKVDDDNLINELSNVMGIEQSELVVYKFNLDAYGNYSEQDTWKTLSNPQDCEKKFRSIDTLKESSEGIGISIYTQTGRHVKFSFQPIFADTVHAANATENAFCSTVENIQSGANYRIRSAGQLLALSKWDEEVRTKGLDRSEPYGSRASYLSTTEEHGASSLCVRQDLDIEVNANALINFKKIDGTYYGRTYKTNTENRTVKITGLCSTFADSVAQRGNVSSLILNEYLSEQNSANLSDESAFKGFIKENNGKISGITVSNSKLGSAGLVYLNNGINGQNGCIESCTIENSTIQGAGLVYTNNGDVNKCSVKNCIIQESGFVYENIKKNNSTGQIYECNIENCSVQRDGFVWINQGGVIEKSNVYDSSIGGNGFAGINTTDSQQNYGTGGVIKSCNVINANIGEMGFVAENKCNNAVIKNCQVYGDVNDYLKYCLEYSDKTKRHFQCYDDNWNPVEDPVMLENEQDNTSEEKKSKIGYFLIRVGIDIKSDGNVKASAQSNVICTGFVNENMNAEITNCSFTGTIKGTSKIAGFIGTNAGSISGSYANGMLEGEDVSGFVYENSRGSGNGISKCHSIGQIQFSKSGCGFIKKLGESNFQYSVQQSYAAIAEVKGPAEQYMLWGAAEKNRYNPAYSGCYVMYPMKTSTGLKNDVPTSVGKCTSIQLSTAEWKNKLGHVGGSKTVAYAQYNSDLKQGDIYPFPCGSGITNYGDWKLTDGGSEEAHTITLDAGNKAVFPEDLVRALSTDAAVQAVSINDSDAPANGTGDRGAVSQDPIPEEERREVQVELGEEETELDLSTFTPVRKGWKLLGWIITSPSELSSSEKMTTVSDIVTKINKISDGDAETEESDADSASDDSEKEQTSGTDSSENAAEGSGETKDGQTEQNQTKTSGSSKAVYELETGTKSYHYAPDAVITVTEDMTLAAVWVPDDDTIAKAKDGTLRMDENGNVLDDDTDAASTGASGKSSGTGKSDQAGTMLTEDNTQTAGTAKTDNTAQTSGTAQTGDAAGTEDSAADGTTEIDQADQENSDSTGAGAAQGSAGTDQTADNAGADPAENGATGQSDASGNTGSSEASTEAVTYSTENAEPVKDPGI